MSSFKKITGAREFAHLLYRLEEDFPLSKAMWQVVRDTQDGLMEANLYTDDWPDFTTVISQEFAPRMSEVADIRIHTRDKERVMQVINGAKLLDKTGKWQAILFFTGKEDEDRAGKLTEFLLKALSGLRAVHDKVVDLHSLPLYHATQAEYPIVYELPPGYTSKDLLPEHADLVAKHWNLKDWYSEFLPREQKAQYLRELIRRFGAIGAFVDDQLITCHFRKSGGIHGITHTFQQHRRKNLFHFLAQELSSRAGTKKEVVMIETKVLNAVDLMHLENIGLSHWIVLRHPTVRSNI